MMKARRYHSANETFFATSNVTDNESADLYCSAAVMAYSLYIFSIHNATNRKTAKQ